MKVTEIINDIIKNGNMKSNFTYDPDFAAEDEKKIHDEFNEYWDETFNGEHQYIAIRSYGDWNPGYDAIGIIDDEEILDIAEGLAIKEGVNLYLSDKYIVIEAIYNDKKDYLLMKVFEDSERMRLVNSDDLENTVDELTNEMIENYMMRSETLNENDITL